MEEISINSLINQVKTYDVKGIEMIKKAYDYADKYHKGQLRQSGEEYITHPLTVAFFLSKVYADTDTICASLLHDTLEDTSLSKDEIINEFNETVALLVEGVTKISRLNFLTKEEQNLANLRKIVMSMKDDIRIIMIKLVDRLHNMMTLSYKSEFKQKENALETLQLYVPIAYYIGAYDLKRRLEDLSLLYLEPNIYKEINELTSQIEKKYGLYLNTMCNNIDEKLDGNGIASTSTYRIKSIHGIYRKIKKGLNVNEVYDILSIKILVNSIDECYRSLGLIHNEYHPINDRFKDYICNPKTNKYSSLHTTVFGLNNMLVQTQLKTYDMDKMNELGLISYWEKYKDKASVMMQQNLENNYQFFEELLEINSLFYDNKDFLSHIKSEILSDKIYVYSSNGNIIELPMGSTLKDYIEKTNSVSSCYDSLYLVNDEITNINRVLKNKDRVVMLNNEKDYEPLVYRYNKLNN